MILRTLGIIHIAMLVAFAIICKMPGREIANAHPWVRGGDGTKEGADVGFDGYEVSP